MPIVATMLRASYSVCLLASLLLLGRISDRIGRKPVLLVSQIGTFCALLTIGSAHALWMLFVGQMIDGMTAGNLRIAQAYISDVTKPEKRTRDFALIGIAFGSVFLLGPLISFELSHRYGFGAPALAAAALSATSIVLTATLLPGQAEFEALKAKHGAGKGPARPSRSRASRRSSGPRRRAS